MNDLAANTSASSTGYRFLIAWMTPLLTKAYRCRAKTALLLAPINWAYRVNASCSVRWRTYQFI